MRLLSSASSGTEEHMDALDSSVAQGTNEAPESDAGLTSDAWRDDELRELVELCPPKQLLVLQLLAQHAGDSVTAWDLREYLVAHRETSGINTERSGRALGAVMAALRKRSKWYGHEPPFTSEWNDTRWENLYCMPEGYAETILDAMREHRAHHMGATD
jgi:hypothetical protein